MVNEFPKEWIRIWTDEEKVSAINEFKKYHGDKVNCTCSNCKYSYRCALAYDLYNNSGDCLLEK